MDHHDACKLVQYIMWVQDDDEQHATNLVESTVPSSAAKLGIESFVRIYPVNIRWSIG